MVGAEELITLRRRGYKPQQGAVVSLSSLPAGKRLEDGVTGLGGASIDIGCDERLDRLDFRCLVGLRVVVCGDDEARVLEASELVQKAGAAAVVGLRYVMCDEGIGEQWLYAHNAWTIPEAAWLK